MNIVNKLTVRHIKTHKRRSLLTVLAIIVSVAMVTAVFTTVFSFIKFMQDSTKAYDGNWHAQLMYDKLPDLAAFARDDLDYYVGSHEFLLTYEKGSEKAKAYAQADAVDEAALTMRNIHLLEGSFPKAKGELLITRDYLEKNHLDWKVGDTVSVYCTDSGTEQEATRSYQLCGIAEGNVSFFDHRDAAVANTDGVIEDNNAAYVVVSFHTLGKTFYDEVEALQKQTGATDVNYNIDLLNYSGVMKNNNELKTILGFVAVILTVIVVASVVMIYDSFAVSYQERERYLGMLASVGATKRQKRSSIYFEGLILGAVGTAIGIAAGFLGMAVTFKSIEGAFLTTISIPIKDTLRVHFSPYIILGSVLLSALTVFISCYIPARRASKTTPIAAIKGTNTVKVKKAKKLRVSKLTRKLYGYEGELAVKNFKRNRRRSRSIVFALVMSVVLFLTVTNFSQMFTNMVTNIAGEGTADFAVYVKQKDRQVVRDYFKNADIDDCVGFMYYYASVENPELFTAHAQRVFDAKGGSDPKHLLLYVMDNDDFDAYLKTLGEDPADYHRADAARAVVFNRMSDTTGTLPKDKALQAFDKSVAGQTLKCHVKEFNEETDAIDLILGFTVTVGKVTEKEYNSRFFPPKSDEYASLILPEDALSILPFEQNGYSFYIFAKDYKAVMQEADEYFENKNIACEFVDSSSQMQSVNAVLDIMKVFIYGFITLLTLIAIINIINSISNSMNERRTEFAMLKSVGVTPNGFKKMIYVESVRYGVRSLLWSIPISAVLHGLMYLVLSATERTDVGFSLNPLYYLAAIAAVFVIILLSLLYSADKIKDDNIIENLKQD